MFKLLIKFLDALCNYNSLKSQKLSFFIYMQKKAQCLTAIRQKFH